MYCCAAKTLYQPGNKKVTVEGDVPKVPGKGSVEAKVYKSNSGELDVTVKK